MTEEPDLFADAEPKTCGNCGACEWDKRKHEDFCALSYMAIEKTADGCVWWYARAEK